MISKKHKFIFIHIPKTGGSSIECALQQYSSDEIINKSPRILLVKNKQFKSDIPTNYKHATALELKQQFGNDFFESSYKFTLVRNTFDRLISLYFWQSKHTEFNENKFISMVRKESSKNRAHWNSTKFILDSNKNLMVDDIFDITDISTCATKLSDIIHDNIDIPHINKSNHLQYSEYYNSKIESIVYNNYKDEIDYFNFSI